MLLLQKGFAVVCSSSDSHEQNGALGHDRFGSKADINTVGAVHRARG